MKIKQPFFAVSLALALNVCTTKAQATEVTALGYNLGPVPDSLTNAVSVSVMGYSIVALRADGSVAKWGNGAGDPGFSNLVTISASWSHCIGFTPQGTIAGFGDDSLGEISGFPPALTNATALIAGYYISMAIRPDGSVAGWGDDSNPVLQIPPDASNVVAIATVDENAIALRADGTVVDWHDGTTNIHPELTNVVAVATDGFNDAVLLYNGTVVEWPNPAPDGLTNLTALTGGGGDFLALSNSGTVAGWGEDRHQEVDIPGDLANVSVFAVGGADGYSHTAFVSGLPAPAAPSLLIQSTGSTAHIKLNGIIRRRYILEESTNPGPPANWAFKQNILLGSASQTLDLPLQAGARFYRVRLMP